MAEKISSLLPLLVLFSHIVFVALSFALIFRNSWGREIQMFVGKNVVTLAFIISIFAVVASLFYSEVMGFEPCVLCWWQRIFLYPLVIIFGMSLWKKDLRPFIYAIPMTLLAFVLAAYQAYISLGGYSILPCTAVGEVCAKVYVMAYGYITLPVMGLTIVFYILLLAWANNLYNRENRNT